MNVLDSENAGSLGQVEGRSSVLGNESDTSSRVDFPLAEYTQLGFDDH